MSELSSVLVRYFVYIVIAAVAYSVLDSYITSYFLRKKLGAKPIYNVETDGALGFRIWRTILDKRAKGEATDFFHEKYKLTRNPDIPTFTSKVIGKSIIKTKDPEIIKALLATQFEDFALGERHSHFFPLLGDGIFTLDGEGWKHSRAMLRPQFVKEQVAHVHTLEPHIQVLAKHIRNAKGGVIDLQPLFFRLTIDSATEFLFGSSVGSLRDESVGIAGGDFDFGAKGFAEAFNTAQEYLTTRIMLSKLAWLVNNQEFRDSTAKVHEFADHYVRKALEATPEELEEKSKGGYVFLYELVKQTRNPKVLRDQLLNILLAGRDTTAGLLSFAIYELAHKPEVWAKLKEEIYGKFGSGDDARVGDITFESLKRCEYLKAFLNEVLRLYPSVPQNFRVAVKNTTLPRGGGPQGNDPILVRKGEIVNYSCYSMHREQIYYGKDADEFKPERWFEERTKKLGWAYLPFNGGPRICLGQQFALTEASYVIARLAQMFPNIENRDPDPYPPKKASVLTMSLYKGALVAMY
ncbi:cytochrome P450 [Scheffersomyces xylosifermentans]|uniref:cytochrome P450 n=1 Tax=Scheffersomyces xylosifermentans TaxID=1304137 RepID=UPI00315CD519